MSKDPDKRSKFLHNLIRSRFTRDRTTIAVGQTKEKISIVGTNDKYHRREVREALEPDEILAKSNEGCHAEENVVRESEERGLHLEAVGSSRPICLDCEELLKEKNVKLETETSGKKSRKRRLS